MHWARSRVDLYEWVSGYRTLVFPENVRILTLIGYVLARKY